MNKISNKWYFIIIVLSAIVLFVDIPNKLFLFSGIFIIFLIRVVHMIYINSLLSAKIKKYSNMIINCKNAAEINQVLNLAIKSNNSNIFVKKALCNVIETNLMQDNIELIPLEEVGSNGIMHKCYYKSNVKVWFDDKRKYGKGELYLFDNALEIKTNDSIKYGLNSIDSVDMQCLETVKITMKDGEHLYLTSPSVVIAHAILKKSQNKQGLTMLNA